LEIHEHLFPDSSGFHWIDRFVFSSGCREDSLVLDETCSHSELCHEPGVTHAYFFYRRISPLFIKQNFPQEPIAIEIRSKELFQGKEPIIQEGRSGKSLVGERKY
jgi:hypothetical protein